MPNPPTSETPLMDEQFREARRQIAASLRASAARARDNATSEAQRYADNPQNMMSIESVQEYIQRARHYTNAANQVEGMEREGFDWGAGA